MSWVRNIFGGGNMAALTSGTKAPDFTLPTIDGGKFSLSEELARGPVVLAFFKVSCPVCQFAFPFLQRIFKAYASKNVTIVGISQNGRQDTAAFLQEFGVTFPVLLDDPNTYPVSNAYGLTNVPTMFLDRSGWRDRNFQRRLGEERNRRDQCEGSQIFGPDCQARVPTQRTGA